MSCQKLTIVCCLALSIDAYGQSRLDSLAGRFIKHIRADRKEKIIVLTDKAFYTAGENIWLKAWCLDSLSGRFMYSSKNLFVDLVDDRDSVVSQLLFNIPQRKTAGMILLPGSLPEGYYWLRAYTTRILKEDSGRIFVKPVYVINPNKADPHGLSAHFAGSISGDGDSTAPRLLFFPEGGSIIAGTTASIAFRLTGAKAGSINVTGYVTDTRNDTVARFVTTLPGMGRFSFDAFNPRKYFAHIKWNNKEVIYPLPAIDPYACQLTVDTQSDRIVRLRVSLGDSLYKKHKTTHILGISRDSLCFAATGTDMYEVNIQTANFPPGKASFFLFDDQFRLVSQRALYIMNGDTSQVVAATDKPGYAPGEKVNLSIDIKPPSYHPSMPTLLSVSVTDARVSGDNTNAPFPSTGLTEIDDALPRHYASEEIDLLMLLQPELYRDWKYVAGETTATDRISYSDSNLLNLRGRAFGKTNEPLKRSIVAIFSGDNKFFEVDTTDDDGRFLFPLSDYDDGTQFNLKLTTLSGKGEEGKLILDKPDYPRFSTPKRLKRGFSPAEIAIIRRFRASQVLESGESRDSGLLKPAIVNAGRGLPDYDEAKRVSPFSDIIAPDAIKTSGINGITNALSNIPGFTTNMNRTFSGGISTSTMGLQPILVLMDGVPINISSGLLAFLESLDANNIEFIEVLKGPQTAIYGIQGAGGVILINSLTKIKDIARTNEKGITTIYPKGYFSQQEAFLSGYNKKDARKIAYDGQSSTVYWNANVLTDNKGSVQLNFFTGRQQTLYSAAIIGINGSGDIFSRKIWIRCQ